MKQIVETEESKPMPLKINTKKNWKKKVKALVIRKTKDDHTNGREG